MALSKGNKSKSRIGGIRSGNELRHTDMAKERSVTNDVHRAAPVPAKGGHAGKMSKK